MGAAWINPSFPPDRPHPIDHHHIPQGGCGTCTCTCIGKSIRLQVNRSCTRYPSVLAILSLVLVPFCIGLASSMRPEAGRLKRWKTEDGRRKIGDWRLEAGGWRLRMVDRVSSRLVIHVRHSTVHTSGRTRNKPFSSSLHRSGVGGLFTIQGPSVQRFWLDALGLLTCCWINDSP